jgi:hypothetical protein
VEWQGGRVYLQLGARRDDALRAWAAGPPPSSAAAGGLRRPRSDSGGRSAPRHEPRQATGSGNEVARLAGDGRPGGSIGLARREGFGVGRSWHGSRLQDGSGPSTACWPVLSLHVRLGGSSSQCAPVGPSDAWWNDMDWPLRHPPAASHNPLEVGWRPEET